MSFGKKSEKVIYSTANLVTAAEREAIYVRYNSQARLYLYADNYLICSVAGIAETESITVLSCGANDVTLGQAALKHLSEYLYTSDKNLRESNASNWTAYRRSGAKSLKSFQENLYAVSLDIMNSAVLVAAQPGTSLREYLSVSAQVNRHLPEKVGEAIRETLAAAKILRREGVI